MVFTSGCNFRCPFCHNPDLVQTPPRYRAGETTGKEVLSFLEKRKGMLEAVVISGGEPCLQPGLVSFCEQVRSMGYVVKIDTNGSFPDVVEDLLSNGLADYVAMDIKSGPAQYAKAAGKDVPLAAVKKSIQLLLEKAPAYEFRTTCARPFISRDIMHEIGSLIQGAGRYILQQCSRNVTVLEPSFLEDKTRFLTDAEMTDLRDIAAMYVQKCTLR